MDRKCIQPQFQTYTHFSTPKKKQTMQRDRVLEIGNSPSNLVHWSTHSWNLPNISQDFFSMIKSRCLRQFTMLPWLSILKGVPIRLISHVRWIIQGSGGLDWELLEASTKILQRKLRTHTKFPRFSASTRMLNQVWVKNDFYVAGKQRDFPPRWLDKEWQKSKFPATCSFAQLVFGSKHHFKPANP